MQEAHHPLFVVKRARLDDRTAKYLYQSATDSIYTYAYKDSDKRVGKQLRQESETSHAERRGNLRHDNTPAIVQVLELGTEKIRDQLNDIKHSRNRGNGRNGNIILAAKSDKQKRRKIGHNRLSDKTKITCSLGPSVIIYDMHYNW